MIKITLFIWHDLDGEEDKSLILTSLLWLLMFSNNDYDD